MNKIIKNLVWEFTEKAAYQQPADKLRKNLMNKLKFEEVFVRECIQNSFDARNKNSGHSYIKFDKISLRDDKKEKFLKGIDVSSIKDLFDNWVFETKLDKIDDWLEAPRDYLNKLFDINEKLDLYVISDHNCEGLGGDWKVSNKDERNRFHKMVYTVSDSQKEGDTGGTYGYGKLALQIISKLRTAIIYSRFEEDDLSNGHTARAIGTSLFSSFKKNNSQFFGLGYLGEYLTKRSDAPVAPFSNTDAHNWIEQLGFNSRQENDFGTTCIIPGVSEDINKIRKYVEKWFWPLLTDTSHNFGIKLYQDGQEQDPPDPKNDKNLYPFVSLFENAKKNYIPKENSNIKYKEITISPTQDDGKRPKKNPGNLWGLNLGDNISNFTSREFNEELNCRVAIYRKPLGLVVEYRDVRVSNDQKEKIKMIGLFTPENKEALEKFRAAETPAHDEISATNDNLKLNFGSYGEKYINSTLRLIDDTMDMWISQNQKFDYKKSDFDISKLLSKDLLKYFSNKNKPLPPDPKPDAFSIYDIKQRREKSEKDELVDFFNFSIKLSDNNSEEIWERKVLVNLSYKIAEGADKTFRSINKLKDSEIFKIEDDKEISLTKIYIGDNNLEFEEVIDRDGKHFSFSIPIQARWLSKFELTVSEFNDGV